MQVAVVGAGAWGTALAGVAQRRGHAVTLWARDPAHALAMSLDRENRRYLPGIGLAPGIRVTGDLAAAATADLVLLCVPAQAVRQAALVLAGRLAPNVPVIACAKGIEASTGRWMTEILAECLPEQTAAVLSGPSFAHDVARGLPTAVTIAAASADLAADLAQALGTPSFRLYHTPDVRGVEIGGATKNVLAIASGIVTGRGLGASAQAALVARSFAELGRFGTACGAQRETLTGLSGLGDLVLTCNSPQSRNFSYGYDLGRGLAAASVGSKLAEGVFTAAVLVEMARAKGIAMPIAESVDAILQQRSTIDDEIGALLARPQKAEA
jgi:glycerol-3-phosphate dehydrogenase (NAD(P)+)